MHRPIKESTATKRKPVKNSTEVENDRKESVLAVMKESSGVVEPQKLRSGDIPGPNAEKMVQSISSNIGKGPIPEKSDTIPIRPIHQVPIDSAIGRAIGELGSLSNQVKATGNPGVPDGDSSSSESDSNSSTGSTKSARRKRRKSKSKKGKSQGKLRVKPIELEMYDGSADPMQYSRHLRGVLLYMKDGNVPLEDQCQRASHFLRGKAAQVYEQEIALYSSHYTLSEMYAIIFNGCFPANFRSEVWMQICRLQQGEKTICEYVYELHQLYTMLGDESDRNKVIKLWEGFNADIREGLYTQRYHKEVDTWNEVVTMAESLELGLNEAKREWARNDREDA